MRAENPDVQKAGLWMMDGPIRKETGYACMLVYISDLDPDYDWCQYCLFRSVGASFTVSSTAGG
jgi:hypothetical protein